MSLEDSDMLYDVAEGRLNMKRKHWIGTGYPRPVQIHAVNVRMALNVYHNQCGSQASYPIQSENYKAKEIDFCTAAALIDEDNHLDLHTEPYTVPRPFLPVTRVISEPITEEKATDGLEYYLASKHSEELKNPDTSTHSIKQGEIGVKNLHSPKKSRPFRADIVIASEDWFKFRSKDTAEAPYMAIEVKGENNHRKGLGQAMSLMCHAETAGLACVDMDISVRRAIKRTELKGWNITLDEGHTSVEEIS